MAKPTNEYTPLENVQRAAVLLMDTAQDQRETNSLMIDTLKDITHLLESMEAANGLLEARVAMLEADTNGS